jgi:hypothetical protein
MTVVKDWDGVEWQKHIELLLLRHHGPGNYQRIPDTVSGDAGLEGFCRSSGYAYQCYAAQGIYDAKKLYEKQRDKISADIGKLINNKQKLIPLLGPTKLIRWVLVVPHFNNKDIISHAETKAEEVRKSGLPYIAPNFAIHVIDDDAFAVERESLIKASLVQLQIPFTTTDHQKVSAFQAAHNTLISNLERKLRSLLPANDPTREAALKEHLIRHHLDGQAALQHIQAAYPDTYGAMLQHKRIREAYLETEHLLPGASKTLQAELQDYKNRLLKDIKGLSEAQADVFAWEAVVDWLLRCPLDF